MPFFKKKPVVIEAVQWTGREEDLQRVLDLIPTTKEGKFDLPNDGPDVNAGIEFLPAFGTLEIPTLEGIMTASAGDWIIKGVKNEIYPCKPDIFEATYDPERRYGLECTCGEGMGCDHPNCKGYPRKENDGEEA